MTTSRSLTLALGRCPARRLSHTRGFLFTLIAMLIVHLASGCATKSHDRIPNTYRSFAQDVLVLLHGPANKFYSIHISPDSLTFGISESSFDKNGRSFDRQLDTQLQDYRASIDKRNRRALALLNYSQAQIDSLLARPDRLSANDSTTYALSVHSSFGLHNASLINLRTFVASSLDSILPGLSFDDLTGWAWSPDGSRLALVCGPDLSARHVSIVSLRQLGDITQRVLTNMVDDIVWTSDSHLLLVLSKEAALWKNPPLDLLLFVTGHPQWYNTFHFSAFDMSLQPSKDTILMKDLRNAGGHIYARSH